MTTTTPTSGGFRQTLRRSPTRSAEGFVLTLWTDDPHLARRADDAGVDRVGIDLDRLGKAARQRGRGTWLSPHREEDLEDVSAALKRATPFARVNPLNLDSAREIEAVLARGASVLMLPMVTTAAEAREFVRIVNRRATTVLLIEHIEAVRRLEEIVAVEGVDEIHIGLNDLALSLDLPNRWLVLADDLALDAARKARDAGVQFGLGGIGRAGDNDLPVPADLVYAEYARTGATGALLSRSFTSTEEDLTAEVRRAREALEAWRGRPPEQIAAAHAELGRSARRAAGW
jgi:HpcH/HpaI aldolase/citrate lyase family